MDSRFDQLYGQGQALGRATECQEHENVPQRPVDNDRSSRKESHREGRSHREREHGSSHRGHESSRREHGSSHREHRPHGERSHGDRSHREHRERPHGSSSREDRPHRERSHPGRSHGERRRREEPSSRARESDRPSGAQGHRKVWEDKYNLRTHAYHRIELGDALMLNSLRPLEERLSKREDEEILQLLRSAPPPYPSNKSMLRQMLQKWMPIWDKVLFFGALAKHNISIQYIERPSGDYYACWDLRGKFMQINYCDHGLEDVHHDPRHGTAHHPLVTLCHEMLHAFIDYYTCRCRKCKKPNLNPELGGEGAGHGPLFQGPIHAFEKSLHSQMRWLWDFHHAPSLYEEIEKTGWKLTEQQIRDWNVDPEEARSQTIQARANGKRPEEYDDDSDSDSDSDSRSDSEGYSRRRHRQNEIQREILRRIPNAKLGEIGGREVRMLCIVM